MKKIVLIAIILLSIAFALYARVYPTGTPLTGTTDSTVAFVSAFDRNIEAYDRIMIAIKNTGSSSNTLAYKVIFYPDKDKSYEYVYTDSTQLTDSGEAIYTLRNYYYSVDIQVTPTTTDSITTYTILLNEVK